MALRRDRGGGAQGWRIWSTSSAGGPGASSPGSLDVLFEACDELQDMVAEAGSGGEAGASPGARGAAGRRRPPGARARRGARADAPPPGAGSLPEHRHRPADAPPPPRVASPPVAPPPGSRALRAIHVDVEIVPGCPVPSVRGFLVVKKLAGLGAVERASPSVDELKAGRIPGKRLSVTLQTHRAARRDRAGARADLGPRRGRACARRAPSASRRRRLAPAGPEGRAAAGRGPADRAREDRPARLLPRHGRRADPRDRPDPRGRAHPPAAGAPRAGGRRRPAPRGREGPARQGDDGPHDAALHGDGAAPARGARRGAQDRQAGRGRRHRRRDRDRPRHPGGDRRSADPPHPERGGPRHRAHAPAPARGQAAGRAA